MISKRSTENFFNSHTAPHSYVYSEELSIYGSEICGRTNRYDIPVVCSFINFVQ
jgi:hypothetical protein